MLTFYHITNPTADQIPPFYRDGFLFLEGRHVRQQPCRPLHYFTLQNEEKQALVRCALFFRDGWAVSPCAASFGSIELTDFVTEEDLERFIRELLTQSRQWDVAGVRLVHYPDCYAPVQSQRVRKALLAAGFSIRFEELNQHLPVTDRAFAEQLHLSERRRLRKCRNAGFTTGIWESPDPDQLFQFIARARHRKNKPITINADTLGRLLADFPAEYSVFTVRSDYELIAACLGIRVRPDSLYYFLPADHEAFLTYSPMVLLIETLYDYCQQENIPLLDLGISTSQGVRNEGLIRFKSRLGAEISPKYTFEITW